MEWFRFDFLWWWGEIARLGVKIIYDEDKNDSDESFNDFYELYNDYVKS